MVNCSSILWEMTADSLDVYDTQDYSVYYDEDMSSHAPCVYGSHHNGFLPALYSLVFVVGFLGNVFVVCVFMVGAQLESLTDMSLLNLALADLLLALSLPFLAHYSGHSWIFGSTMCSVVLSMYYVAIYSGIFFIVLMSIDRYLDVVHAVRVRKKVCGISLVPWLLAVVASFPELWYLGIELKDDEVLCSAYPNSHTDRYLRALGFFKMNVLSLLVPLGILGFCYSMILRRRHMVRSSVKDGTRLVLLVTVVFFCCWTPYNIAGFLKGLELKNILTVDCGTSRRILVGLQISEAVAYSHCSLNPLLYVLGGEEFKRYLLRLLRQTPCVKSNSCRSCLTQDMDSRVERSAAI